MTNLDTRPDLEVLDGGQPCTAVEVLEPRPVPLGGVRATTVYRTLPQRRRSLVRPLRVCTPICPSPATD